MNHASKPRFNYVKFAFRCLLLMLIVYGVVSFYATVSNFNDRLDNVESDEQETAIRTMILEDKLTNCYSRDAED